MASAVTLPAVCATTECVAKGFPSCSQGVCLHCVTENVWAIKTVKGLHDNVLFTFSKKYTGQSRLYKHQEKHWLLLIPNSNLSLCWSSRYLFTWFTFTPVFMRTWSHMFALICVSVSATLCKAPQLNQQLLHWSGLAYYMFSWFYLRKEALFQYNSS